MEPAERETIVLINDADLEDGYFRISTTKKKVYEMMLKRIGPDEVVSTKVTLSANGDFSEGNIRCRSSRLAPLRLLVKRATPTGIAKVLSDSQRAALAKMQATNLAKRKKEKNNAR